MGAVVKGQHAPRTKGKEKNCNHHQRTLELVCKTCQDLACIICVTTIHKGHDFCDLTEIVSEAKEEIKTYVNHTERIEIPYINQAIVSAKDILKKDTVHLDDLEKQLTNQLNKLKQDLELLSANINSSFQQLRTENTGSITDHIKALESIQKDVNRFLNECKTVLQKGSHVNIYDVRNEIRDPKPLPVKPTLATANFVPNTEPPDLLTKAFGIVTINQIKYQGQEEHVNCEGSVDHHQLSSTQPSTTKTKDRTQYNLLTDTKVISEFTCPFSIGSICITKDGYMHFTDNGNEVQRINNRGVDEKEIEYNVCISDVRVSPTTQHIWTCSVEDCSVMECAPSQKPVVRFNTDSKPQCLCFTVDNCILIGMPNQITKYTTQGKILLTTKPSKSGQPVVKTPRRITECSVTHNVAVADEDDTGDGGDGKPIVVVMDRNLQEIFCYRGDISIEYHPTRHEPFMPFDVRYDSVGNLVISDCARGYVHLLSGGGDYLKLIYTGSIVTCSVDLDVNNVLWVIIGLYGCRTIKLLQYCNTDV